MIRGVESTPLFIIGLRVEMLQQAQADLQPNAFVSWRPLFNILVG